MMTSFKAIQITISSNLAAQYYIFTYMNLIVHNAQFPFSYILFTWVFQRWYGKKSKV